MFAAVPSLSQRIINQRRKHLALPCISAVWQASVFTSSKASIVQTSTGIPSLVNVLQSFQTFVSVGPNDSSLKLKLKLKL